jgi:Flp pilus assembly protein TadG
MKALIDKRGRRGSAMVEVALLAPWIFFLFVGVLDFGFYSYAAICTQNAARAGALASSFLSSSSVSASNACNVVLPEMNSLPNTRTLVASTYCATPPTTVSSSSPIAITATTEAESDGSTASVITVTYLSLPMIPIPGALMGQMTMTRTAKVPVLNSVPTT